MTIIKTVREYQLKEVNGKYILTNEKQSSLYISEAFKEILLSLDDARFWHEAKDRIAEDNFEDEVDLFELWETLPQNIQDLIDSMEKKLEASGNRYLTLAEILQEFEAEGYTFDYGLDAEPFMLKKISN